MKKFRSDAIKLDESCKAMLHNDANLVGFFEQQLEYVLAATYDVQYPQLKGTIVIPVDTSVPSGAETIAFTTYDSVGMAKIISDYSQKLPRVGILGQKTSRPIRSIGASFGYSIQEIRAAQLAGSNLTNREAIAVRMANDQAVNRIAWAGDTECGLYGFLNHPNVPTSSVPNDGTGSSTKFVDKTPEQILRDMNAAVTDVIKTTKGVHTPNTLLLPLDQYTYVSHTIFNPTNDKSILESFQGKNPGVTVDWVNELDGAGTAGVDVMIAYERNITNLALHIPQPFETFPAQAKGLEFEVAAHSRIGGVIFYYPLSANIKEGI
jgi:hypothetical protein